MTKPIGNITVGRVNKPKQGAIDIRIDRATALGNPYFMKGESMRNDVCDKYRVHLMDKAGVDVPMTKELIRIIKLVKAGIDVNLQCHCAPKRCHGDEIKDFVINGIKQAN